MGNPSREVLLRRRVAVEVGGIVQGVGFRPFIYRLAQRHQLSGWVRNTLGGVEIEAEGEAAAVGLFVAAIREEAPPLAVIGSISFHEQELSGEKGFAIIASAGGEGNPQVAADGDVCDECLRELFDPSDRRYRYPFINCTNCGPRYSIITGVPYDRTRTTMKDFGLCETCLAEYNDQGNRRFHAQPNACPACGPSLRLISAQGGAVPGDALAETVRLLKEGAIVAVKGIGGYHLAADAANDEAVARLRRRKNRDEKPFALMAPGVEEVREFAQLGELEERLILGNERPIILLRKRKGHALSHHVAPLNGYFGVMLPSAPLHYLLLRGNFTALVMTSGNLSDEPMAYADDDARGRLADVADYFLLHDRRIHARVDDSVIRVFQGAPLFLRRSRGYAPRGIAIPEMQKRVLAVGAELKSTLCLAGGGTAFLSQHIGDLQNAATLAALEQADVHLREILGVEPELVAHDMHPDYLSTRFAEALGVPRVAVQHHHAHMAACMAENRLEGDVIGVVFDGTGFGPDGTVWGGEFLVGGYESASRAGHLRQLPLPGGDAAVKEPWRMALSYCHACFGNRMWDLPLPFIRELRPVERNVLQRMIEGGLNSPLTSSCGRMFDAVAALLGLRTRVTFEGQAAMELEASAEQAPATWNFPYVIEAGENKLVADGVLPVAALVEGLLAGEPPATLARRFHETLAALAAEMCDRVREKSRLHRVVLSGGVFQNRLFTERLCRLLEEKDFSVFTHRLVPPNDGGIALGQAVIAARGASFPQSMR
ncbi:carbamoyltransferase HypF [Geobacter sp. DSM 9736]|uniref:carbamoyltransferase HypF n=1 Tax=Geobacter sp. DSM 9736 TaxID=1277350 RepID=UPI000B4FF71D|nr:carbamoyltransferase HypF [Geobacter sp. DSM 9736]SNB47091.1 Hydrogenase maturation protein, carbamoyltransferase HypF [Geobacter sp. DSM 9736]